MYATGAANFHFHFFSRLGWSVILGLASTFITLTNSCSFASSLSDPEIIYIFLESSPKAVKPTTDY